MTIVFEKTNVYDYITLCASTTLIIKWLNHIEREGMPFPSNFDFNFFWKGVRISLEIEHSLAIPAVLYMLFRTLHFFPIDHKNTIVQEIFTKHFHQLMYSWSFNVRELFSALLLYQVEYLYIEKTLLKLRPSFPVPTGFERLQAFNLIIKDYQMQAIHNPRGAEDQFDQQLTMGVFVKKTHT